MTITIFNIIEDLILLEGVDGDSDERVVAASLHRALGSTQPSHAGGEDDANCSKGGVGGPYGPKIPAMPGFWVHMVPQPLPKGRETNCCYRHLWREI